MSLSKERFIDVEVRNCGSCPFHFSQPDDINMDTGATSVAGFYCLHPTMRHKPIMTEKEMNEVELYRANLYLTHLYGEPFPPDCPLARKELGNKISGQRDIDLT